MKIHHLLWGAAVCCTAVLTGAAADITPHSVTLDGKALPSTQMEALFDGSLRDTPNLRTGAAATLEIALDTPARLDRVRIYSGYRANRNSVATAMSIASAKLEAWDGHEWHLLGELSAAVDNPELCWDIPVANQQEFSCLRLTIHDSTDTARRQDGQMLTPERRGTYLREISISGTPGELKLLPPPETSSSPARKTPMILLIGQSNMDGRNDISDLPGELREINRKVRIQYNDYTWRQMRAGNSGFAHQNGTIFFGPELSFGAEITAAFPEASTILLLKSSRGGTSMTHWNPPDGLQYKLLLKRINKFFTDCAKLNPEIVGAVWMQGESDSLESGMAERYAENLTAFIAELRRQTGNPSLPFVIGQVYAGDHPGQGSAVRNPEKMQIVHDAQQQVADQDDFVALVVTDDLTLRDPYHYDAASTVELGKRFAQALAELVKKNAKQ